ncbi:MAG: hypothetical protein QME12_09150 [Nanoarchaeota archaeon]|nr:hypothetical protein [Nanoarchaeota archaeon]
MENQPVIMIPVPSEHQSVPVPGRVDRADFVDKIKPEQVVEIIRHRLLGEDFQNGVWAKILALQKSALTEKGAWEISNLMLSSGSINTSISRLSQSQINNRLKNLIKEVMAKCLSNWREYGIEDVGQFYYIKSLVFSNALVVLSQAGEGSIQELFKTTVSEQRNISTNKQEPGKLKRMLGMSGQ